MREEILFLTHKKSRQVEHAIRELRDQMGNRDLTIISQSQLFDIDGTELFLFEESLMHEMDFPTLERSLVPDHAHFPVFEYISQHKGTADYYWVIEYDVRFTGEWSVLFDHFATSDADFISTNIRYYHEIPDWGWWGISHPEKTIKSEDRIRSFNPIYRISKEAVKFLEGAFKSGWKGHNETTFPTLLYHNGYQLLDCGGNGDFAVQRNNFYISRNTRRGELFTGTMRYRPAMKAEGLRKNMLYHPVKHTSGVGFLRSNAGNFYRLMK